jgi:uncharacterized protein DUF6362
LDRDELRQRFREAAYTLRRLPMPRHGLPANFRTHWPDIAYEWLAYGWTPARAPRIPPSPQEISRLDEVLGWCLRWLSREQRVICWARATGWTWRQCEAMDELERDGHGRQAHRLRVILGDGEARILAELNGTPRRMRIDARGHRKVAGDGKGVWARVGAVEGVQATPGVLERV